MNTPEGPAVGTRRGWSRVSRGWLWPLAAAGLAAAVLVAVIGWGLVDDAGGGFAAALEVADQGLAVAAETIEVADRSLEASAAGVEAVRAALEDAAEGLALIEGALEGTAAPLEGEIPRIVQSVQDGIESLAASARLLDQALSLLGLGGTASTPAVLGDVGEQLGRAGAELRAQAAALRDAAVALGSVRRDVAGFDDRFTDIADALRRARANLAGYRDTLVQATGLTAATRADLPGQRERARLLVLLLAAGIALPQAALVKAALRRPRA